MSAATAPARRRTQAERRETTRRILLDAARDCLVEDGYAGFSSTQIVRRAGLSQGALFKHFPTKSQLLAATAEHLYGELIDRYVARVHRLERKDESARIDGAVKVLWQLFESPEWGAGVELITAARTDADLRNDLEPVVAQTAARVREVAAALWPDAVDRPDYDRTIDLILELMQGMAVSRFVDPSPAHYRRLLEHITALARATLSSDASGGEPR